MEHQLGRGAVAEGQRMAISAVDVSGRASTVVAKGGLTGRDELGLPAYLEASEQRAKLDPGLGFEDVDVLC